MTRRSWTTAIAPSFALIAAIVPLTLPLTLGAQISGGRPQEEHLPVSGDVREQRMVHVMPHKIIFDSHSNSATVEFSNHGDKPVTAEVQVLYAFMDFPHGKTLDTTFFTSHWESVFPHDTVILNPGPKDRFAGRWLSGLPAQITLGPKQKKTVTVKITPPGDVPGGEYTARVLTIVRPPELNRNKGKPKDERTIYSVPVKGLTLPILRDSVEISYRKAPVTMGVKVGPGAKAAIDTIGLPGPEDVGAGNNRLWFRVPLELTGNMHFDGVMHVTYRNIETGYQETLTPAPIVLYRNSVTHWWGQADKFGPGKYEVILTFDAPQNEVSPDKRVPVTPVTVKLPFEIWRR